MLAKLPFYFRGVNSAYLRDLVLRLEGMRSSFLKELLQMPQSASLPHFVLRRVDLPLSVGGLGLRIPLPDLCYSASLSSVKSYIEDHIQNDRLSFSSYIQPLNLYGSREDFDAAVPQQILQQQRDKFLHKKLCDALLRFNVDDETTEPEEDAHLGSSSVRRLHLNVLLSSGGPIAGLWLLAFQHDALNAADFTSALRTRLALPQVGWDLVPECNCGQALAAQRAYHHLVCCRSTMKYARHNRIRDTFAAMFGKAGLFFRVEPHGVLTDDDRGRPDLILRELGGAATKVFDVKCTTCTTVSQLAIQNPKAGQSAKAKVAETIRDYRARHDGTVIPLVLEAHGFVDEGVLKLLRDTARAAAANPIKRWDSESFMSEWSRKLSVQAQRGVAELVHDVRHRCFHRQRAHIRAHHLGGAGIPEAHGAFNAELPPGLFRTTLARAIERRMHAIAHNIDPLGYASWRRFRAPTLHIGG